MFKPTSIDPKIIKTFGVEVEVEHTGRRQISVALEKLFGKVENAERPGGVGSQGAIKQITHDASVESMVYELKSGLRVYGGTNLSRRLLDVFDTATSGAEIISNPLSYNDLEVAVGLLLPKLSTIGESFSPRASIHIHSGFPIILESLKCLIAVGIRFEGLLFAIAGMGHLYRGHINNSIYSRPLQLGVAVPLNDSDGFYLMKPERALRAQDMESFWKTFGLSNWRGGTTRYHPARYFSVNFYSTLLIGTAEFRTMNLCFDPDMVMAGVRLYRLMAEIAAYCPTYTRIMQEPELRVTVKNDTDTYFSALKRLILLGRECNTDNTLSEYDVDTLLRIIEKSPAPVFKETPIITHVKNFSLSKDSLPVDAEFARTAQLSGNLDIHTFGEKETSILYKE